jgi:Zn finger protein HypA/HybF involved in hydrogenase expression
MAIDDPSAWAQGALALKTAFESLRTALSMVKDIRSLGSGSEEQQKVIDTALTVASSNTAIAEAELAKAFGYQLCKCEFPPIPMKTVGSHSRNMEKHMRVGDPVYECPKCGYNTAGPYGYYRIAPERKTTG